MHIHNVHGDLLVTHEADGDHQYKGEDKQKEVDHDDFCKKRHHRALDTYTFRSINLKEYMT